MGVKISGELFAQKNVRLSHGPSGVQITTAPPLDNGGDGSSFSPTDLFAASLGSCMLTLIALNAAKEKIDLGFARIEIEKNMAANPRRVSELLVKIELPGRLNPEQRALFENAALTCPVALSVSSEILKPVEFCYI